MTTLLLLLTWFSVLTATPPAAGVQAWAGNYRYEEEPVKAVAGYSMAMTWQLRLQPPASGRLGGQLNVEGQQTFMKLKVRASGTPTDAQVIFVQGLDGAGYQQLKPGDVLFRLHKAPNGTVQTYWGKLTPRLLETYRDGQVAFVRK
ncbi:DUF5991 domain-containing protein [Hymenobacter sp. 15J16-1T3B]|uniref:DUF5991 domain-containing protein n=1 Tax=Hymenobacter sp. 15J16-1T3B TaxID=2886941 RepID=UPI001D12E73D|nr:DUF5991 domain-containing protein [Hymenobacter sp. 15J16-1T3B]MCC3160319.1 DUF5991 domain-containing protein [Hymenobacter sp. 15J16-1T3B]